MRVIVGIATLMVASVATAQPVTVTSQNGRKQVTAIRTEGPMSIDGVLDEAVWSQAPPAVDFIQADPLEGVPATEITEVRIAFDDENLYIGALCRDSQPAGIVVNDIRKDFADREQDTFEVLLDTFADRRNGFVFVTNARGARADTQMASEGREVNPSWDAVWWVNARTTAEGGPLSFAFHSRRSVFTAAMFVIGGSTSHVACVVRTKSAIGRP